MKRLKNSKIQKVKEIPEGFSLELYSDGKKQFLIIAPKTGLFVSNEDYDAIQLSHLGVILRNNLSGEKVVDVRQYDLDRIVELETQKHILFLEFFRDGNLILTTKLDKKIVIAKEMRTWRHRTIKPNFIYNYPPPSKYDKKEKIRENLNDAIKSEYEEIYNKFITRSYIEEKSKLQKIQEFRLMKLKELAQEKSKLDSHITVIYSNYVEIEDEFEKYRKLKPYGKVTIREITFDASKTFNKNIQHFYTEIKKIKKKMEGLSKAIDELKLKEPTPFIKKEKSIQKEWYEKFRWFISSDGFLVVAGKDAKSNEQLIRKYMKPEDLVFHTDITGSPFVLIKNPNNKTIPQSTINETAQFCASYSKAWKIGISAADVYYVKPEQVKKEGGLPTGSFMIYGKREWIRRIRLELTIGITDDKVIVGPKSAIIKQTKNYFSVIPLEENFVVPNEFKKHETEILRLIPYGKGKKL